jgi:superfamily II DNA or RNA helicase
VAQTAPAWQLRLEPRAWQLHALKRWDAQYRGVVSVVTGAGKTAFAEMCMLSFLHRQPDARFLILVPGVALVDQWYVALHEDLGVAASEIGVYSGHVKSRTPSRVNLMVLNTGREWAPRIASSGTTALIVDECHRAGSPVNRLALRGRYAGALGMSATPVRDYDSWFEEFVSPVLGPVIFEYDYRTARADGVVVPFELVNVRVDLLKAERRDYDKLSQLVARLLRHNPAITMEDDRLKRLLLQRASVSAKAAMRVPVAVKLVERHRGVRTIVFHERIDAANAILRLLHERGVSAAVYHTRIGESVRRENLRLFRRGLFECLVTCRALDEGTNVPETSVAIIASSTRSTRQRIQRLGRVLRPARGKEDALIYTLYATDAEETRLKSEATRMEDVSKVQWLQGRVPDHGKDSN